MLRQADVMHARPVGPHHRDPLHRTRPRWVEVVVPNNADKTARHNPRSVPGSESFTPPTTEAYTSCCCDRRFDSLFQETASNMASRPESSLEHFAGLGHRLHLVGENLKFDIKRTFAPSRVGTPRLPATPVLAIGQNKALRIRVHRVKPALDHFEEPKFGRWSESRLLRRSQQSKA